MPCSGCCVQMRQYDDPEALTDGADLTHKLLMRLVEENEPAWIAAICCEIVRHADLVCTWDSWPKPILTYFLAPANDGN